MVTPPFLASALIALAAVAVPHATPVRATGTVIQRCAGDNGVPIYTDQACAALGATPLPMSSDLLARLENGWGGNADAVSRHAIPARRSPASGCARSTTQLVMDLQGAFALGDVNRIAESYHWVGLSHSQGTRIMQRLERLGGKSLLDARYFDASIGSGWIHLADASTGAGAASGIMQLVFGEGGDARSALDFNVQRYHGCYFIRF